MTKMKAPRARRAPLGLLVLACGLGFQACSPSGEYPVARRLRLRGEIISRFRLFHEIDLLQVDRLILEKKTFVIAKPDRALLTSYLASSRRLAAEGAEVSRHFTEDAGAFTSAEGSPDAKAFVDAGAGYVESALGCVERLNVIVERLERMTREPNSWTKPDYDAAVADYSRAAAEMDAKAKAFRGLIDGLRPS